MEEEGMSELEIWSNGETRNLKPNSILRRRKLDSLTRKEGDKDRHMVGSG
ncbi:hypothetical protein LEMLEM_LOCUS4921, partial [Lemmus lemmus]